MPSAAVTADTALGGQSYGTVNAAWGGAPKATVAPASGAPVGPRTVPLTVDAGCSVMSMFVPSDATTATARQPRPLPSGGMAVTVNEPVGNDVVLPKRNVPSGPLVATHRPGATKLVRSDTSATGTLAPSWTKPVTPDAACTGVASTTRATAPVASTATMVNACRHLMPAPPFGWGHRTSGPLLR